MYTHTLVLWIRAVNCSETACAMQLIKSNFPVLTPINKASGRIVYIFDHEIISSNPCL